MKKINVVIIDDQEENIKLLEYFLSRYCPLANIIGRANSLEQGVVLINNLKPDLLFLDTILNNKNGFDLLEAIKPHQIKVIFVSVHNEHAIKALKCNALYYLQKPIIINELQIAFNLAYAGVSNKPHCIDNKSSFNFITISGIKEIEFVRKKEIVYLKSEGRYTELFLEDGRKITVTKNIGLYEKELNNDHFFRIHNSYIINTDYIVSLDCLSKASCILKNNTTLPISIKRKESFYQFLKLK